MTTITVMRRLRCDQLEAVIARYRDSASRACYGVFIQRLTGSALTPEYPRLSKFPRTLYRSRFMDTTVTPSAALCPHLGHKHPA